jgi:hypothetical protein
MYLIQLGLIRETKLPTCILHVGTLAKITEGFIHEEGVIAGFCGI